MESSHDADRHFSWRLPRGPIQVLRLTLASELDRIVQDCIQSLIRNRISNTVAYELSMETQRENDDRVRGSAREEKRERDRLSAAHACGWHR